MRTAPVVPRRDEFGSVVTFGQRSTILRGLNGSHIGVPETARRPRSTISKSARRESQTAWKAGHSALSANRSVGTIAWGGSIDLRPAMPIPPSPRAWPDRRAQPKAAPFYLVDGRGSRSLASPDTLSRLNAARPSGWQSIRSRLVSGIWTGSQDQSPGVVSASHWSR